RESIFVVFRHKTESPNRTLPHPVNTTVATIAGPWDVSFPPNWGAPDKIQLPELASWTANSDPGVKFFSGTATYTKSLAVPQDWMKQGTRIWLDLGSVRDLAEVTVNGTTIATLWKPPYKLDVTDALKAGANQLQIKVTNEWSNRIAGDAADPNHKILS